MSICEKIKESDHQGNYQPRIDYIRFPFFRNIAEDSILNFDSPFTVFVGQNGCGKSSVLQALYGSPKGYSLTNYWFSTQTDPIKEPNSKDRHCFIYSHSKEGREKEVLKRRSFKAGQPDLFDSSPAIGAYGMSNPDTRTLEPIEKEVVYLNFRAAQNAFEKVFNEERPPKKGIQNFLRDRSRCLHTAFNYAQGFIDGRFSGTHEPVKTLTVEEVAAASKILGRKYESVKIVKHRLFKVWGHSIMMTTLAAQYSEAFAGSGEFAVFLLVHEVMSAPPKSLLLLDEPETSLHPGAQRALQAFLLDQCLKKRHQIVICSHSANLVENLPSDWIKVFRENADGKFAIIPASSPREAFHFIGHSFERSRVIVEDRLAKLIFENILSHLGTQVRNIFEVDYAPGGETQIKKDCLVHFRDSSARVFVVFDADVKPSNAFTEIRKEMPIATFEDPDKSVEFLELYLAARRFNGLSFAQNGGNAGKNNKFEKRDLMIAYIEACFRCVKFFPMDLETMVWDDDLANKILETTLSELTLDELLAMPPKDRFFQLGKSSNALENFDGKNLDVIHGMFVQRWIKQKGAGFIEIQEIAKELRASNT